MADVIGDPYALAVRGDGAVAHWRLNERVGTTVADSIGGATGTIAGGTKLNQSGVDGDPAVAFDGSTGRIAVPVGAYSSFGLGPLSLEAWVYLNTPGQSAGLIDCGRVIGTNGIGAEIHVAPTSVFFSVGQGTANLAIATPNPLTVNQWHHVVATYVASTGTMSIFVDGVMARTQAFGNQSWTINATAGAALGSSTGAPSNYLNGRLDEAAIYKVALTPAQIANHYAIASGPTLPGFSNSPADSGISSIEPPPPVIDMTIPGWSNSPRGAAA